MQAVPGTVSVLPDLLEAKCRMASVFPVVTVSLRQRRAASTLRSPVWVPLTHLAVRGTDLTARVPCAGSSFERSNLVVDRSTTGMNSGAFGGLSVDGRPVQRTRQDTVDELNHLAKVRVAGPNPVFRSKKVPGQGRISADPA